MKKLLIVLLLAFTFASCKKEITLPTQPDLTNYVNVDIHVWHTIHGPMKSEYYLDLGQDVQMAHPWQQVIDKWSTDKPFFPCKSIYVTKTDYNTYL